MTRPCDFPPGKWRLIFETAAANNWWLRNTNGGQVKDHGNKFTTNLTLNCPKNAQNQSIHDWFPGFINNTVLQNGASLWDGVILDDCWVGIWWVSIDTWLNPYPIDSNGDHIADAQSVLDQSWSAGNDTLLSRLRRTMPPNKILTGNGQNHWYQLNGAMIETFPFGNNPDPGSPASYSWNYVFQNYGYFSNEDHYNNNPQRRLPECDGPSALSSNQVRNTNGTSGSAWPPPCCATVTSRSTGRATGGAQFSLVGAGYDKPIGTPWARPEATYQGQAVWRRDFTSSVVLNPNVSLAPRRTACRRSATRPSARTILAPDARRLRAGRPGCGFSWPDAVLLRGRRTTHLPGLNMSVRYSRPSKSNFFLAAKVCPPSRAPPAPLRPSRSAA
jgi:hypothetical protein